MQALNPEGGWQDGVSGLTTKGKESERTSVPDVMSVYYHQHDPGFTKNSTAADRRKPG